MQIEGKLIQTIVPKDHNQYFGKPLADNILGLYMNTIQETDCPYGKGIRGLLAYWNWCLKNRRLPKAWRVLSSEPLGVEGQFVAVTVNAYEPLVHFWAA